MAAAAARISIRDMSLSDALAGGSKARRSFGGFTVCQRRAVAERRRGENAAVGQPRAAARCNGPVEPLMNTSANCRCFANTPRPSSDRYTAWGILPNIFERRWAWPSSPGPAVSTKCRCLEVDRNFFCYAKGTTERLLAEPPWPACTNTSFLVAGMRCFFRNFCLTFLASAGLKLRYGGSTVL